MRTLRSVRAPPPQSSRCRIPVSIPGNIPAACGALIWFGSVRVPEAPYTTLLLQSAASSASSRAHLVYYAVGKISQGLMGNQGAD